jgi:hypothetical protein
LPYYHWHSFQKISWKFPEMFQALLPLTQLRTGNFLGNFEGYYHSHSFYSYQQACLRAHCLHYDDITKISQKSWFSMMNK